MARQLIKKVKRNWLIYALSLAGATLFDSPPGALAQAVGPAPIRVESNEVFVPVVVLDEGRVTQLHKMDPIAYAVEATTKDLHLENLAIQNIPVGSFHVFEDGKEQKIQNVTPEAHPTVPIRDNLGQYEDYVGIGGGIWTVPYPYVPPSRRAGIVVNVNVPHWLAYLIAYFPPPSPDGSCHQVTVKVDHPNSLVFARDEYCDAGQSAADPLKGTRLGRQMESHLASAKKGKIDLLVAAVPLFTKTHGTRVQISVDFSPNLLKREGRECVEPPEIRVLGMVYTRDGTLTTRFSDVISRFFDFRDEAGLLLAPNSEGSIVSRVLPGPSYETQIHLGPGEYHLQVALMDGNNFGRAEVPLTVERYDGKHLTVGGIALAKRYHEVPVGSHELLTELPEDYSPLVSKGAEVTPTASTRFKRDESLYFYFEVFEPQSAEPPAPTVEAHLRIIDTKTGQVKNDLRPVDATPYTEQGNPVIPIAGGVNIGNLSPGSYRLEVQVADSAGQSTPWRAASFTVE